MFLANIFTSLQCFEYIVADFRLSDGVYGSTFYMATDFHGFHLIVCNYSFYLYDTFIAISND